MVPKHTLYTTIDRVKWKHYHIDHPKQKHEFVTRILKEVRPTHDNHERDINDLN